MFILVLLLRGTAGILEGFLIDMAALGLACVLGGSTGGDLREVLLAFLLLKVRAGGFGGIFVGLVDDVEGVVMEDEACFKVFFTSGVGLLLKAGLKWSEWEESSEGIFEGLSTWLVA